MNAAAGMYGGILLLFTVLLFLLFRWHSLQERIWKGACIRLEQESEEKDRKEIEDLNTHEKQLKLELGEELKSLEQLLLFGKKEDAIRAIQRLDGQFEQMPYVESRTKNCGVNGAVSRAVRMAAKEQVIFRFHIAGAVGAFPEGDMGVLLCNLLDNAIEGALKSGGRREVLLNVWNFRGYLKISLENTVEEERIRLNPGFCTDKKDKSRHGFGMRSIERILRRFQGVMDKRLVCRDGDWVLEQVLLLRFPQPGS